MERNSPKDNEHVQHNQTQIPREETNSLRSDKAIAKARAQVAR